MPIWAWILIWVAFTIFCGRFQILWFYWAVAGASNLYFVVINGLEHQAIWIRVFSAAFTVYCWWRMTKEWPRRKKRFAAKLAGYKARAIQAKMRAAIENA